MNEYHELVFRRQFLLTYTHCNLLKHWNHETLSSMHIYAHPDVDLTVVKSNDGSTGIALIGFIIDPINPTLSNAEILNSLHNQIEHPRNISKALYSLAGRFVLIVKNAGDTYLFNDPCGLRSVFYTVREQRIYAGSQPWILKYAVNLADELRLLEYNNSSYRRSNIEHWIPSGCSVYKSVHHLVPNHYLRFSTFSQERFWPAENLRQESFDNCAHEVADLLAKLVGAANERFSLSASITAGWDTRLLLAATKRIAPDVYYYTLQYRDLALKSHDIRIPANLLRSTGYSHNVINCMKPDNDAFIKVYEGNSPITHYNDWGKIAFGMFDLYPPERVAMKGNCSEIARCFYYKSGTHEPIKSPEDLIKLEKGWNKVGFVRDAVDDWFFKTKPVSESTGVDIMDLFYWEHRMGSWQAQSQLEWDIVQEVYTPYNHRGLLEKMLSIPSRCRCAPKYYLYEKICKILWPELLKEPVNPPHNMRKMLKHCLYHLHLHAPVKHVYHAIFPGEN